MLESTYNMIAWRTKLRPLIREGRVEARFLCKVFFLSFHFTWDSFRREVPETNFFRYGLFWIWGSTSWWIWRGKWNKIKISVRIKIEAGTFLKTFCCFCLEYLNSSSQKILSIRRKPFILWSKGWPFFQWMNIRSFRCTIWQFALWYNCNLIALYTLW